MELIASGSGPTMLTHRPRRRPAAPCALRRMTGRACSGRWWRWWRCCSSTSLSIPGFLAMRVQDGHLYGSLIDILQQRRPDPAGRPRHDTGHRHPRHRPVGRRVGGHRRRAWPAPGSRRADDPTSAAPPRSSRSSRALAAEPGAGSCGTDARVAVRHPADHRHARADDRRPRHRAADHRRADHHRRHRPVRTSSAAASCSGCRSRSCIAAVVVRRRRPADPAHRAGHAARVGRRQPRGQPARRRALARHRPGPSTSSAPSAPASPA